VCWQARLGAPIVAALLATLGCGSSGPRAAVLRDVLWDLARSHLNAAAAVLGGSGSSVGGMDPLEGFDPELREYVGEDDSIPRSAALPSPSESPYSIPLLYTM